MTSIPGYRLGDPSLPASPIGEAEFEALKASLLFGAADIDALRAAQPVLAPQVEAILDVWYGFVGSQPHLLQYFSDPHTGQPLVDYLGAVRRRFGQWIIDTCRAQYDGAWLAWQDEIGRRHHRVGKNQTDDVRAAPHIPMSQLLALAIPISVTLKPFLDPAPAAAREAMHAAFTKAVWLQAILWARPYVPAEDF
jgi:hypothetical protein